MARRTGKEESEGASDLLLTQTSIPLPLPFSPSPMESRLAGCDAQTGECRVRVDGAREGNVVKANFPFT